MNRTDAFVPGKNLVELDTPRARVAWSTQFGVTTDALERAVAKVGPAARDVAGFLGKRWRPALVSLAEARSVFPLHWSRAHEW